MRLPMAQESVRIIVKLPAAMEMLFSTIRAAVHYPLPARAISDQSGDGYERFKSVLLGLVQSLSPDASRT
jgi:hypothetical protein